jgi:hypothetical protein
MNLRNEMTTKNLVEQGRVLFIKPLDIPLMRDLDDPIHAKQALPKHR